MNGKLWLNSDNLRTFVIDFVFSIPPIFAFSRLSGEFLHSNHKDTNIYLFDNQFIILLFLILRLSLLYPVGLPHERRGETAKRASSFDQGERLVQEDHHHGRGRSRSSQRAWHHHHEHLRLPAQPQRLGAIEVP